MLSPVGKAATMEVDWITPDWPAPPWVRALTTTRLGGCSRGPYAGLNLGDHVGDDPRRVARNRQALRRRLTLPAEPHWLRQVHACGVVEIPAEARDNASSPRSRVERDSPLSNDAGLGVGDIPPLTGTPGCTADAVIARARGQVCAVLTADCLPVLLCDREGTRVAAVHAGWRGLAAGVIEAAVGRLGVPGPDLLAWLGPAIGPRAFEVGAEVRKVFVSEDPRAKRCFHPGTGDRWLAVHSRQRERSTVWN